MKNNKFRESVRWGLNIFAPNYQKAHPYAKSGRTNRLAYVEVTLFWQHYTAAEKSTRESPLENWVVYNTTSLPRRRDTNRNNKRRLINLRYKMKYGKYLQMPSLPLTADFF